ncbi:hypothetical protein ABPG75_001613 [Micractinium tetrahymenae]
MSSPAPYGPPPGTPRRDDGRGKLAEDSATDDEEENSLSCRICWTLDDSASLLSPCLCAGTQKHVHLKCLRRWQESVQKRDISDERAFRCSVCRTPFSVPPPKARTGGGGAAMQALRGLGGALVIVLLACGLSGSAAGPPWPHLALLLLLIFGSRWHWLPGLGLLLGACLLAGMHARGLRVVVRVDGGGRLGVALIRHGAAVPGIGAGVLLVASEGLDHSPIFRRSVILLTQHGRGGARGVMLSQPIAHPPALPAGLGAATSENSEPANTAAAGASQPAAEAGNGGKHAAGTDGGSAARGGRSAPLRHFLGGPVGMPGEGVNHEVLVLHTVAGVPGARRILPPPASTGNRTTAAAPSSSSASAADPSGSTAGAAGTRGAASGGTGGSTRDASDAGSAPARSAPDPAGVLRFYEGGSLSEVLERAAEAADAVAAAAQCRRGRCAARGGKAEAAPPPPVLLFHGVCAWAEGQLEGELRAGAWAFTARPAGDLLGLLGLPHEELWQTLAGSPALTRVR